MNEPNPDVDRMRQPTREQLHQVLGEDLLTRLAGSAQEPPDEVAARLHHLALIVADLAGSYSDEGVRRWLDRPRSQLGGVSAADLLRGAWDPQDEGPRKVRALAASLSSPDEVAAVGADPVNGPDVVGPGVHAMLRLRTIWGLTWSELARLLGQSESSVRRWSTEEPQHLEEEVLLRMSHLIAIYFLLAQLRGLEHSGGWLRSQNSGKPFHGRPPLEHMLGGRITDLVETRSYLWEVYNGIS